MTATIRLATPADAHAIAQVRVMAWRTTYRGMIPAAYLDAMKVEDSAALWERVLTAAPNTTNTFVAQSDGMVVGFAASDDSQSHPQGFLYTGLGLLAEILPAGTLGGDGSALGGINGLGITWLRIPPFMMTLGMSSVLFGVTLLVSGGVPIYGLPPELGQVFGFGEIAGIPVPALVAAVLVIGTYTVLEWTRFGRHLYATGGNQRAAELSGVRTGRVIVTAFMLSSVMAALSGLLLTARLDTGESNIGASLPLESIAACVIAGVSLAGGQGRTLAVLLGTLLIMLVQNGLNLMQVGAYAQTMAIGAILIFAMALARH